MADINTVKGWVPINWNIASSPYNWFIVVLMVLIATIAIKLVHDAFTEAREKTPTNSS